MYTTAGIPVQVHRDTTLRAKIIDACGMTCTFCHNEGTPVTADHGPKVTGARFSRGPGRSGRVSIYVPSNDAGFLPATMLPDPHFATALAALRGSLGLEELHLTGGEPTLHPKVPDLIRIARDLGFTTVMTSNGENGARILPHCARAGLERVNFSIFGTTPAELAQVQHNRYGNRTLAARKIAALQASIRTCLDVGIKASVNIVVPGYSHIDRVLRLFEEHSAALSIRLLNSLDDGGESVQAILQILDELEAIPVARHLTAGASGSRTEYRLSTGRLVHFKEIRPVRLPTTCRDCRNTTTIGTVKRATTASVSTATGADVTWSASASSEWTSAFRWKSSSRATSVARSYACARMSTPRSPVMQPPIDTTEEGSSVETEFEARALEIEPSATKELILSLGGRHVGERFMRRYVYDIEPGDQSRWIRLRDTGTDVSLTVKEIISDTIDGTRETEITVNDFEATNQLLGRLGLHPKSYQENHRTSFILEGVRLELDHWPLIPPYLEIEGDTTADVIRIAGLLGYSSEDLTAENTIKIYRRYGYELNDLPELRFPDLPELRFPLGPLR